MGVRISLMPQFNRAYINRKDQDLMQSYFALRQHLLVV